MAKMRQLRSPRAGFTTLELIFAITIMMIGVAAAFGGQITTQNVVQQSRETQLALSQLEAVAETIIAQPPQDLPEHPNFGDGTVVDLATESGLEQLRIVCRYPDYVAGNEIPNPLEVNITATWTDRDGRPRDLRLATMVSQ